MTYYDAISGGPFTVGRCVRCAVPFLAAADARPGQDRRHCGPKCAQQGRESKNQRRRRKAARAVGDAVHRRSTQQRQREQASAARRTPRRTPRRDAPVLVDLDGWWRAGCAMCTKRPYPSGERAWFYAVQASARAGEHLVPYPDHKVWHLTKRVNKVGGNKRQRQAALVRAGANASAIGKPLSAHPCVHGPLTGTGW